MIVGILTSVSDSKSTQGALIRMIGGLFLAFTVIAPITDFDMDVLMDLGNELSTEAEKAASRGQDLAADAMSEIIKQETQAYILDKAASYGAELTVEVEVNREESAVPESVVLRGAVSPYAKAQLQQIMETELGIPKENQIWIG